MTFGEIVREVGYILKDQRPDVVVSIPDFVNEAYQWVAAETSLPKLKTVISVSTVLSQAYATMSSNFDGRLLYCGTVDGELNILDGGITEMLELHPDMTETGDVEDVAIEGTVLWYAKIPETVTSITCLGYIIPAVLTNDADTPSALPDYLHRGLLVNKAAAIGYSKIEDGLEGPRPNTDFYESEVKVSKGMLEVWVEKRRGHARRSIWDV